MDDWEELDWDKIFIPDLLIESREHERKLLEERKKMEQSDANLTEKMFSNKDTIISREYFFKPIIKREKPKDFEKRKQELLEKQRQLAQKKRDEKAQNVRLMDMYNEAKLDEYDKKYDNNIDKYTK